MFFIVSAIYSFILILSQFFTPLFWICYLIIRYKVYVACIIYMNCALFVSVHFIEYLARMGDLSELIDKLDDGGILHSVDSTVVGGSGAVGVAFPVASSSWILFTGLFFNLY